MTSQDFEAVTKPLLYQAVAAPKVSQKMLLDETLKLATDKSVYSDILRDNFTSAKNGNCVSGAETVCLETVDKKSKLANNKQEKENYSTCDMSGTKTESEDSTMITCGKTVVNNIIDKLYSSEIPGENRKLASDSMGFACTDKTEEQWSVTKYAAVDTNFTANPPESVDWSESKQSVVSNSSSTLSELDESNNNTKSFDEADGMMDIRSSRKRNISQSSSKGNESVEEGEESQPLRKSRRRNKGQRYQMLINDGIIQPSKERMAALHKHSPRQER